MGLSTSFVYILKEKKIISNILPCTLFYTTDIKSASFNIFAFE